MNTIAVVDDDPDIRELLSALLVKAGFRTVTAGDGRGLRSLLSREKIDLVLLDLMLPGQDGYTLCRELRESDQRLPIIMLTARDEEIDRVVGLELGADDYVTKPFSGRELVARIKAVLRRMRGGAAAAPVEEYHFADWRFFPARMELLNASGVLVPLSSSESELLLAFLRHAQRPLSRDKLLDLTKGRTAYPFDRSIDTQVSRLRRKIGDDARQPELIKTVWGSGYIFTSAVEPR